MSKRLTKLLSLALTLVMLVSLFPTTAFALGEGSGIGIGGEDDWGRDIGEDEIQDFTDYDPTVEDVEEYDLFQGLDEENGAQVTVLAPMGSLPTLAEIRLESVPAEDLREAVDAVVEGEPEILVALDISFWLGNEEIEPSEPVRVKISAPELDGRSNLQVIHFPDEREEAETMNLISEDELSIDLGTNEVAFVADSFSIYVIVDGSEPSTTQQPRVTYYFLNELDSDGNATPFYFINKNGDTVDYQIVKNSESLEDPGHPIVSLEKKFLGWFLVEKDPDTGKYSFPDGGQPIDFSLPHPKPTTVLAGDKEYYLAARFGEAFIVTFWDNPKGTSTDQMHIVTRKVVYLDLGADYASVQVDNVTVPSAATQVLSGWTSDDYISGTQTTYSLTEKPIWDQVTQNFNLYPIFSSGHWLRFSGGPSGSGAGYRQAIFVTNNTTASELADLGTVARDGYSFAGWFYKGSDEDPFDGTEAATNASGATYNASQLKERVLAVDGDLTLYAHWNGNPTTYRVATWLENADNPRYSFDAVTSRNGNSGDLTNVTVTPPNGYHLYGSDLTKYPEETDEAYLLHQQTIKGDGTTVVNVYFNRNTYTFTFTRSGYGTIHTVTRKFGSDISDIWEFDGTDNVHYPQTNTITSWQPSGSSTYTARITRIERMPMENITFSRVNSNKDPHYFQYFVQVVPGDAYDYQDSNGIQYKKYTELKHDFQVIKWNDDFWDLLGFEKNRVIDANGTDRTQALRNAGTRGLSWSNSWGNTLNFFYLRKQYSIYFDTQISGGPTAATIPDIYYEANIASSKATEIAALNASFIPGETIVTVTGSGDYVFKGWYENSACLGDTFNFNQTMPAGNINLFAKWEKITYLVQIDPRGGEILPDVNEVTYTWLKYGDQLREYSIRRDFVETDSSYSGDKYYYVNVLADDDPNCRADSGAFSSAYRKGFYIKTTDLNNEAYAWWKENGFIDTSKVYKEATTIDNWAFVGWYKAKIDPVTYAITDTNDVYDFSAEIVGETAIYAKWRRSGLFSVQYHTENGTVSGQVNGSLVATDSSYSDQAKTQIAYTPSSISSTDNKIYVFQGWAIANPVGFDPTDPGSASLGTKLYNQGDEFIVDAAYADSGHYIHLVAVYAEAQFDPNTLPVTTLTFNPNFPEGATDAVGETKKIEGIPVNTKIDLSQPTFTIELAGQDDREEPIPSFSCYGYVQTGWNSQADGQGTAYKLNDVIGVDNADPKANTLYAVWEAQFFYVFHSSTGKVDKIRILDVDKDKGYDLTKLLDSDNYLYGGYFKGYLNVTDEQAISAAKAETAATTKVYDGTAIYIRENDKVVRYWNKTGEKGAYTDPGNALIPVADKVYYLREIPADYLGLRVQVVFNWYNNKEIDDMFLITTIDNNYYSQAGFHVQAADKSADFYASYSLQSKNDDTVTTIKAVDINGIGGFVGVWDGTSELITNADANSTFTVRPFWITLDNVRVDDPRGIRTFNIGDKTFGNESGSMFEVKEQP